MSDIICDGVKFRIGERVKIVAEFEDGDISSSVQIKDPNLEGELIAYDPRCAVYKFNVDLPNYGSCGVCKIAKIEDVPASGTPNTKKDQGKNRLDLISIPALQEIGLVYTMGASKYAPNGWRDGGGMAYSRLIAATMRHFFDWCRGIDKDEESGLSHLAHAGWNIIALLDYVLTGNGEDDRWKS